MRYIDGYLLPVPTGKIAEYKKIATKAGKVWMKYGALMYVEAIGDDLLTAMTKVHFPDLVKAKKGETVIFSFVVYKSRKHRDQVNAKVMKDPYMSPDSMKDKPMPFDMNRMAYGGFEAIVDL